MLCTPDRIRTGATAVRGRRARPLHNGGLNNLAEPSQRFDFATNREPLMVIGACNSLGY